MSEQITVNQHYVPRFYMKPFSTIVNEGTKKEKTFISFYQFRNTLCRDNVPVSSICSEDYFYDDDGHIENELAQKERLWAYSMKRANCGEDITESDINNMQEFAIYQMSRTKAMLSHSREMVSTILTDTLSNNHSDLDKEVIRGMVEKKVENEITPEFDLAIVKDTIPTLRDMGMVIIENKTSVPFITSDVPVIVINPLGIFRAGLGDIGEVILFPISELKAIVFYDNTLFGKIPSEIDKDDIVHTFNKYQYISADERILSSRSTIFERYIEDEELNEIRVNFHSVQKTNTMYDGFGTFIAAKSRSLRYYYDIQIFKLPKQLRKIPADFRETFSRKYSYEQRRALLCRVYRKPDFISDVKEASRWKKVQEYSKVLLDYLDYYWKTPKEDRVISGEYMNMLQTVPVTSYKPQK